MKRRLEHSHKSKSDDMDIGQVDDPEEASRWDMGGNHMGHDQEDASDEWDMDAMGKGKSKGKGKFGGWYQQGKGTGSGGQGAGFGMSKGSAKGGYDTKGRGKTAGKGGNRGDEKGKDRGKGACYKCGHPGHAPQDCPDPRPFQGYCTLCSNWGHTAKFCQAKRIQEMGQEPEEPN